MKQWVTRHWTPDNEGKWYLKKKETNKGSLIAPAHPLERYNTEMETQEEPIGSLSWENGLGGLESPLQLQFIGHSTRKEKDEHWESCRYLYYTMLLK